MSKETLFVSFSGGRTSAYMCRWIIEKWSHKYNLIFLFANTGQEDDKTLEFVDQCDRWFGLNLVWLEAAVNPEKNKGTRFKVVDFKSAARNGEPFEEMIKKYGIPNPDWPHCTRELKLAPMETYMQSLGFKRDHKRAVGIRSDEIDRMDFKSLESGRVIYPLIKNNPMTKADIRHWWAEEGFDLQVDEHYGNCVTCWKKSDRKIYTIAKNDAGKLDFFERMEEHRFVSPQEGEERFFFRRHRNVSDMRGMATIPFIEFVDHMPELQLKLDIEGSCGASCEAV